MTLTQNLLIMFIISTVTLVISIIKKYKIMIVLSSVVISLLLLFTLFLVFILIPAM